MCEIGYLEGSDIWILYIVAIYMIIVMGLAGAFRKGDIFKWGKK